MRLDVFHLGTNKFHSLNCLTGGSGCLGPLKSISEAREIICALRSYSAINSIHLQASDLMTQLPSHLPVKLFTALLSSWQQDPSHKQTQLAFSLLRRRR